LLLLRQAFFCFLALTCERLLPHPLLFLEARLLLAKLDVFTFAAGAGGLGAPPVPPPRRRAPGPPPPPSPPRPAHAPPPPPRHPRPAAAAPRRRLDAPRADDQDRDAGGGEHARGGAEDNHGERRAALFDGFTVRDARGHGLSGDCACRGRSGGPRLSHPRPDP